MANTNLVVLVLVLAIMARNTCAAVTLPSNTFHTLDPSNWMRDSWPILSNRTLTQITLPGTHDSGAYWLSQKLSPQASGDPKVNELIVVAQALGIPIHLAIMPWALTQNTTLYQQAAGGMRYFDIRATFNGTHWLTHHFLTGHPIEILLRDVATFIARTTHEFVILEISHFSSDDRARLPQKNLNALRDMILEIFGELLIPRTDGLTFTLNELLKRRQRVLVSFEDFETIRNSEQLFDGDLFAGKYANTPNTETMIRWNDELVAVFNRNRALYGNKLMQVSWTLTPNEKTFEKSLFDPKAPKSLQQLSAQANSKLLPWTQQTLSKDMQIGSILMVDFFQTSQIMHVIEASLAQIAIA